jgi:hypothetical protein
MIQYRIVPVKDGPQYVLMETKKWFFTWKNDLEIEINGVTKDGIPVDKEKEIQTLYRKIKIQYDHDHLSKDDLLKISDQLAELDCYSDNS